MSTVTYFKNENVQFGLNGLIAGTASSTLIGSLGLVFKNLTVGQHVVKFAVSVGGEYVSKEFILDVLEGGVTVKGDSGQSDIYVPAPVHDVTGIALGGLIFNAIGTLLAISGAKLLAFSVIGSVVWAGAVEVYQSFTGNTKQLLELVDGYDSNGDANVLAGAFYEDRPTDIVEEVGKLLDHAVTEYGYIIGDRMVVQLKGVEFFGAYTEHELTFQLYNDSFMRDVADAVFGGSKQDFLSHFPGSGDTKNGDFYSTHAEVFFMRDGLDKIYIPATYSDEAHVGYDITDIISGSGSIIGNANANLVIGGSSNDTLNGGAGVDYLIGGSGNDDFIVVTEHLQDWMEIPLLVAL